MKRNLPLLIIGSVLVLAVVGAALLYKTAKPATQPTGGGANTPTPASPPEVVQGANPPRVRGNMSAPVTIEEYGDFQCPPCAQLHPDLKKMEVEYGERLNVVFRQYPLTQIHQHAFDAARAAEAAGQQGKFWEMHDLLYEKQLDWSLAPDPRAKFAEYAKSLQLDPDRFLRDMVADLATARVTQDMRRGRSLGVKGTPTLFINGRPLSADDTTPAGIRRAIDTALRQKGQ